MEKGNRTSINQLEIHHFQKGLHEVITHTIEILLEDYNGPLVKTTKRKNIMNHK